MGLHTSYLGHIAIEPPLSPEETDFVRSFGRTRHWGSGEPGVRLAAHPADNESRGDVSAYNRPAPGTPGLWCPWTVCKDGCCLHWDGIEKPYDADRWLEYLIDTFLAAGASASERRDRRRRLAERRRRFEAALAEDRLADAG